MKNIFLLLFLLAFIFPEKSIGQIPPRLTEKIYETYSQNEFWKHSHRFIIYEENHDTLSVITKVYNYDGEIISWTGDFFEYDEENRLVKKNNKRYNSEVDLWISNHWREYYYDEDGCVIREESTFNVGGTQGSWYYFVDENCRKTEGRETLGSDYNVYQTFIYPDANNSLITSRNELYQGVWKEVSGNEWIRNEKGDVTRRSRMFRNDLPAPDDTAFFSIKEYEYIYNEDFFSGQLTSKFQKYYANILNLFNPPFNVLKFQFERRFDYEYYCDGLVSKETLSVVGESKPSSRILYFYEGKNDCFDFEQDLEMTLSPNPGSGEIAIRSLIFESGDTEIQVFTTSGQLAFKNRISSRSHYQYVDLSALKNGIYIIYLRSGKHFSTSKIVVTK